MERRPQRAVRILDASLYSRSDPAYEPAGPSHHEVPDSHGVGGLGLWYERKDYLFSKDEHRGLAAATPVRKRCDGAIFVAEVGWK